MVAKQMTVKPPGLEEREIGIAHNTAPTAASGISSARLRPPRRSRSRVEGAGDARDV